MLTDYKISSITNDGRKLTVKARFYEGEINDVVEKAGINDVMVTRYRRAALIDQGIFEFMTKDDIEIELRAELKKARKRNGEARGKKRTPIPEQSNG